MKTIIFTIGLPASGKTTYSKKFVKDSEGTAKRINKDDLRNMLDSGVYSPTNEELVNDLIAEMVYRLLVDPIVNTIIIDGCNLQKHIKFIKDKYFNFIRNNQIYIPCQFEEIVFNTDTATCIKWDIQRGKQGGITVGKEVILHILNRYQQEGKFLNHNNYAKEEKTK